MPFVFTLSPDGLGVLLQAPLAIVIRTTVSAAVGISALAVGLGGWLRAPANPIERAIFIAAGLLLCDATPATDLVGLTLTGVVFAIHWTRTARLSAS